MPPGNESRSARNLSRVSSASRIASFEKGKNSAGLRAGYSTHGRLLNEEGVQGHGAPVGGDDQEIQRCANENHGDCWIAEVWRQGNEEQPVGRDEGPLCGFEADALDQSDDNDLDCQGRDDQTKVSQAK